MLKLKESRKPHICGIQGLRVNGIIFKGSWVVIPKSVQQSIKSKLHEGHLGIVLTQLRARNCVYILD